MIGHPIRLVSAGLDDEQPMAYGICQFPNGLYSLLRLDLRAEEGFVDWSPCAHAWSEEALQGSIRRWTGISVPLWMIRGEDRTNAGEAS